MNLKKTKTPIMGVAAFLIILFHLLPISRGNDLFSTSLRYIVTTAYISVDIFFFMSGYMAIFSDRKDYLNYIKRKFLRLYPIFILSCVIYIIMGRLALKKALLTLFGVDLCISGGGSFLWFIPALMIFYIVIPWYIKLSERMGKFKLLALALLLWGLIMILLENVLQSHGANIFLCRIPVTLLGVTAAQYEGKWKINYKLVTGVLLLILGMVITWNFGYMSKVKFLISDIFYVVALPHVIGAILVMDVVFSSIKSRVFNFFGKISLELYCFQMVFGALFFKYAMRVAGKPMIAFAIVFVFVVLLSYLASIIIKTVKGSKLF